MNVRFFGRSAVQAEVVNAWWTRNRPSAPRLFADELASALRLVAAGPGIGALYEPRGAQGVRRLLLPRTRYFVYYAYDRESAIVGVLSIWSCARGRPPSLGFFKGFEDRNSGR